MAQRNNDNPEITDHLADEAAALVGEGVEVVEEAFDDNRAELAEIGAEIERIKASVSSIAESTSHYVKRRVAENSTDLIAENPVRAALWAAFAGFLIGRLSR